MKRNNVILLLTFFFLLAAMPLEAQQSRMRKRKSPNVSLALGKTVRDSLKVSYVNLGLLTNIYQLKGFGVNLVSSVVANDARGLQVSGLANICGGTMGGLQMTGIANVNGYDMDGLSVSGFLNVMGHNSNGMAVAGIVNVFGKTSNGVAVAGLTNVTGGSYNGLALGGLGNVAADSMRGLAVGGLTNVAGGDLCGVQVTSLLNLVAGRSHGVQAALGNVSVEQRGLQLGAFNYSEDVKGVQAGLFNYAAGNVKGVQLGLVNYTRDTASVKLGLVNISPRTRVQLMVFGGNASKLNLGVRFLNRYTYTILGVGAPYLKFSDKFSGSLSYRAGLHWAPVRNLRFSGDVGYSHIETFKNKEVSDVSARMYALQARVNVEYQLTRKLGLMLSGGYGWTRNYGRNHTFEKKGLVEFGLVFF